MSLYTQIYVRMETMGEPYTTIMILINRADTVTG